MPLDANLRDRILQAVSDGFDDQVAFLSHQCRMGLTLAEKLITLLEAWVSHDTVEEAISSRKRQQDAAASPTTPP